MLEDRDYMRESPPRFAWTATVVLVAINVAAFVLQETLLPGWLYDNLALSLDGLKQGYVWQLLSFQFMHGGWLHLFLNSWALYMFGREVEYALGKTRFLVFYFSAGVIGGLFQVFVALIWPHYFNSAVVGASAGIFGVVSAYAMLNPERPLALLLFFVIPVRMRAKVLLWINLVLAALGIAFPRSLFGGNVAHAAHLGGILTGLAYIRLREELDGRGITWAPFKRRNRPPRLLKATVSKMPFWPAKDALSADPPEAEFISKEVDPILDKISSQGIQSLTERERKILEKARDKMGKR